MPLRHVFHRECIDKWFRTSERRPICPIDKAGICLLSLVVNFPQDSSTFLNSVPGDQEEVQVDWDKAILGSYLKILQLSMGQLHQDPERFPVLYFPLMMSACTSRVFFLALCCSSHVISTCSLDSKRDVNQHTASSKSSDTCVYQGVNESYLGSPWQLDAKKKWFLRRCGKLFCFECCYFLHQVHSHFKPRVIYFFKLVKWSLKVDGMV